MRPFETSLNDLDLAESLLRLPPAGGGVGTDGSDPLQDLLAAQSADWALLRLVGCSAAATLLLGLAGSLVH